MAKKPKLKVIRLKKGKEDNKNSSKKNSKSPKKKKVELKFKITFWKIIIGFLILFTIAPLILSAIEINGLNENVETSQALVDIKEGKTKEIVIQNEQILLTYEDDTTRTAIKEDGETFADLLSKADIDPSSVKYTVVDQSLTRAFAELVGILLPVILIGAFFFLILRSQARGAGDVFSFGKSKAKLFAKGKQDTTFDDVAGVDDAKKELVEIVDFLKKPAKYKKIGARTPKGVLLFGPAGVGKTLLAKAVAGEANVPFFSMAGSEFMEMLVGVGASRVRDLFGQAKAQSPSIIFIDEIDAIGRQRGRGMMAGHDEREQTLNQILVEMDGFTPSDNVVVVAATNRADLLDPALLRPGRFDRRVTLDMPDKDGRLGILKIHAAGKKFGKKINWDRVAERTVGFSGADLENMLNEAAITAASEDKKEIDMKDIEEAATKVKLGPTKKRLQTEKDRKITAYHEAGHAIVSHYLLETDPVHRISIVARGMSLGHTLIPPAADRVHESKSRMHQLLSAMLGGRAAEEIFFKEITSGASNDIEKVTDLARAMVTEYGMSDLGAVNWGPAKMRGTGWMEENDISDEMKYKVDMEVKKIVDDAYKLALATIKKHKKEMDEVVKVLMKKETMERDEFEKIVGEKRNGSK